MSLGKRVRHLIDNYGFTSLSDASKKINIDYPSLSRIVNDKQTPSADRLLRIADFFNVSVDWLLTGRGPGPGNSTTIKTGKVYGGVFSNTNNVNLSYQVELPNGKQIQERRQSYKEPGVQPLIRAIHKLTPRQRQKLLQLIALTFDINIEE